jgi:type VI secretion system secreted protein VgrG
MGKYTQDGRLLAVTVNGLGKDDLLLERFTGHEAISELFHFRLEMLAEKPIKFADVLGQGVTVALKYDPAPASGPDKRYFNGIIKQLSQGEKVYGGAKGEDIFFRYEAEMVPALWLLTRRMQSRIFQQKTVPQILNQILKDEWGLDVPEPQYDREQTFYPRDYCVQYRETDFAFVSRLLEEEGIFYYFLHEENKHPLVLRARPQARDELPEKVSYREAPSNNCVHRWVKHQEIVTGQVTLWDSCFELPGKNLTAQRTISESVVVGKSEHNLKTSSKKPLEHYDYPGGYAQRFDGVDPGGAARDADLKNIFKDNERTVAIRMEEVAAGALRIDGESRCRYFGAGRSVKLVGHFDADDTYLLTRVEHQASIEGAYRSGSQPPAPESYTNRFQCLPGRVPFRPRRVTVRPIIPGPQTAVVVGLEPDKARDAKDGPKPDGDKAKDANDRGSFVDRYGRVKVQFPWDREGKNDANSSCWVRVAQTWAGARWGAFFWPHVGHEVVVAFEEGDPDRPLIVGSVYNADNMPPFALPEGRKFNGIRSCSLGGNPTRNFSGFVFHDLKDDEQFILHSCGDVLLSAQDNVITNVWGNYLLNEGKTGPKYKDEAGWSTPPAGLATFEVSAPTVKFVTSPLSIDGKGMLGLALAASGGWNYKLSTNPIGMVGELEGDSTFARIMTGLVPGAVGGDVAFNVGASVKSSFGPSYSFSRGRNVKFDISGNATWSKPAATLALAACMSELVGLIVLGSLKSSQKASKDWITGAGTASTVALPVLILGGLTLLCNKAYAAASLRSKEKQMREFNDFVKSADTGRRITALEEMLSATVTEVDALGEEIARSLNPGFEVNSSRDKVRPKDDVVTEGDWEVKAGSVQLGAFDKAPTVYVQAVSTGSSPQGTITLAADDWTSIQGGKSGVDIRNNDPKGDIDIGGMAMTSGVIKLRHGLQKVVLDRTSLKAEMFKDVEISALGSITLKVGKSQIRLDPQGITIEGVMIRVEAVGQAQIEGKMVQIKSQGPGPVRIDSALPVGGILIG